MIASPSPPSSRRSSTSLLPLYPVLEDEDDTPSSSSISSASASTSDLRKENLLYTRQLVRSTPSTPVRVKAFPLPYQTQQQQQQQQQQNQNRHHSFSSPVEYKPLNPPAHTLSEKTQGEGGGGGTRGTRGPGQPTPTITFPPSAVSHDNDNDNDLPTTPTNQTFYQNHQIRRPTSSPSPSPSLFHSHSHSPAPAPAASSSSPSAAARNRMSTYTMAGFESSFALNEKRQGRGQGQQREMNGNGKGKKSDWVIDVERIDSGMEEWRGERGDGSGSGSGSSGGKVILVLGDAPQSSIDHLLHSQHLQETLLILPSPSFPTSSTSYNQPYHPKQNQDHHFSPSTSRPDRSKRGSSKLRLSSSHTSLKEITSSSSLNQDDTARRPQSQYDIRPLSLGTGLSSGRSSFEERCNQGSNLEGGDEGRVVEGEGIYPTVKYLQGVGLDRSIKVVLGEASVIVKEWRNSRIQANHPRSSSMAMSLSTSTSTSTFGTMNTPLVTRKGSSGSEEEILPPHPPYANNEGGAGGESTPSSRRSSFFDSDSEAPSGSEKKDKKVQKKKEKDFLKQKKKTSPSPSFSSPTNGFIFDAIVAFVSGGEGQGQGQGQNALQAMLHEALLLTAAAVPILSGTTEISTSTPKAINNAGRKSETEVLRTGFHPISLTSILPRLILVTPPKVPERLADVLDSYLSSLMGVVNEGVGEGAKMVGYVIHQRVLNKPLQRQGSSERSSPFDILLSGALICTPGPNGTPSSIYLDSFTSCRFITSPSVPSSTSSPDLVEPSLMAFASAPISGPRHAVAASDTMSRQGSDTDTISTPGLLSDIESCSSGDARPLTPLSNSSSIMDMPVTALSSKAPVQFVKMEPKKAGWMGKIFGREGRVDKR